MIRSPRPGSMSSDSRTAESLAGRGRMVKSPSRGRIDKRQAILDAAFTVFARRGYENACVREIAEEAGVAKPTVYHHLRDKENLFRQAIEAAADTAMAENLAVAERLRAPGDDLRAALEDTAYRMLQVCCGERARALRWLTYAQVGGFPDLIAAVQDRTQGRLGEALAEPAGPSLAGRPAAPPATRPRRRSSSSPCSPGRWRRAPGWAPARSRPPRPARWPGPPSTPSCGPTDRPPDRAGVAGPGRLRPGSPATPCADPRTAPCCR